MPQAEARAGPPTLAQVVHRAVTASDPEGREESAADLLARFEDRDEPITAPADIELELAEAKGAVDPQDEDPVAMMVAAVATYLAFRRDEIDVEDDELLRLAARAEFEGSPPPLLAEWLSARDIKL